MFQQYQESKHSRVSELKAQGYLSSLAFPWMAGQFPSFFPQQETHCPRLSLAYQVKAVLQENRAVKVKTKVANQS